MTINYRPLPTKRHYKFHIGENKISSGYRSGEFGWAAHEGGGLSCMPNCTMKNHYPCLKPDPSNIREGRSQITIQPMHRRKHNQVQKAKELRHRKPSEKSIALQELTFIFDHFTNPGDAGPTSAITRNSDEEQSSVIQDLVMLKRRFKTREQLSSYRSKRQLHVSKDKNLQENNSQEYSNQALLQNSCIESPVTSLCYGYSKKDANRFNEIFNFPVDVLQPASLLLGRHWMQAAYGLRTVQIEIEKQQSPAKDVLYHKQQSTMGKTNDVSSCTVQISQTESLTQSMLSHPHSIAATRNFNGETPKENQFCIHSQKPYLQNHALLCESKYSNGKYTTAHNKLFTDRSYLSLETKSSLPFASANLADEQPCKKANIQNHRSLPVLNNSNSGQSNVEPTSKDSKLPTNSANRKPKGSPKTMPHVSVAMCKQPASSSIGAVSKTLLTRLRNLCLLHHLPKTQFLRLRQRESGPRLSRKPSCRHRDQPPVHLLTRLRNLCLLHHLPKMQFLRLRQRVWKPSPPSPPQNQRLFQMVLRQHRPVLEINLDY
eukprot:gene2944-5745_t